MSSQSRRADAGDFRASRPHPLSQVPDWQIETDVVVVGFGAAGASAAIEAAAAGARSRYATDREPKWLRSTRPKTVRQLSIP